ncbi:MAG TPA: hotdog fold thioesterase [Usitatibacteraceae bacterium]|nr:hotdog fold thioesterase [Usitatibacteraceae bacterium]HRA23721.1 hotdog fold thioesterase [Usitatibacteraceae bacterium]
MGPFAALQQETLLSTLGIEVTEATRERVVATMPVGPRVHQPFGLLHGGASVALAETVASTAAWMNVDQAAEIVVGIEINANHLRAKRDGVVTATATPLHVGRRTQVWDVRIADEEGRLVCASRCTLAVVPRPPSER